MIRLFVGCAQNEDLESQMVLEYTLRKYASEPVDVTWMRQSATGPWSGWKNDSARTPFTHFRWGIPAVCHYDGRAIYVDVDFFFRADIAELWGQPMSGVLALRGTQGKLRTSALLIDCAAAKGHIPDLDRLRRIPDVNAEMTRYFQAHRELLSAFHGDWNCIDGKGYPDLTDPRIKAIHHSRIETQLHLKYALPRLKKEGRSHWYTGPVFTHERADLVQLFDSEYRAAFATGYRAEQYRVSSFDKATRRDFTYKAHRGVPA